MDSSCHSRNSPEFDDYMLVLEIPAIRADEHSNLNIPLTKKLCL
jgi:hypothetical protein